MEYTIPKKLQDRLRYFDHFVAEITANPAKYAVDESAVTTLASAVATARTAMAKRTALETMKESSVTAMQNAVAACTQSVRSLLNTARNSPQVTDADLARLGASRRSKPTPVRPPDTAPRVAIGVLRPGQVELRITPVGQFGPRGRPKGAIGASVVMCDATKPAGKDGRETGHRVLVTRPYQWLDTSLLSFARIRVYAQWITKRGEVSPYSNPIEFNPQS